MLTIHQMHGGPEKDVPWLLAQMRATVVRHNPDAEHRYWSDADLRGLLADDYPALLPMFETALLGVQRSDLARLVVLHRFGGVYVDLDIEALRPFASPLVGGTRAIVAPEPAEQVAALGYQSGHEYLCNAFLYSPRDGEFVMRCLREAEAMWRARGRAMWGTFDVLGGHLLTRVAAGLPNRHHVLAVAPSRLVYPINDLKLKALPTHAADAAAVRDGFSVARALTDVQAVHYWIHGDFEGRKALATNEGVGAIEEKKAHSKGQPCHALAWALLSGLYGL